MRALAPVLAFPLLMGGTIAVAERLLPFRTVWNRAHGDVATDLLHALVSSVGTVRVVRPLVGIVGVAAGGPLSRALGATAWPTEWPYLAQLASPFRWRRLARTAPDVTAAIASSAASPATGFGA